MFKFLTEQYQAGKTEIPQLIAALQERFGITKRDAREWVEAWVRLA